MTTTGNRPRWATRLVIGAASTLALAATAMPALAEEPPFITASGRDTTIGGAGSPGKAIAMFVTSSRAVHPTITFDVSALASFASATVPDDCTSTATNITCPIPDGDGFIYLPLRPGTTATPGTSGALKWTTRADNVATETGSLTVTVADGVDLVVTSPFKEFTGVPRGGRVGVPVAVANAGNETTPAFSLQFFGSPRFSLQQYSNCQYGEESGREFALCEAAVALTPGEAVELADGFGVTADADGYWGRFFYMVQPADAPSPLPNSVKLHKGTGPKLEFRKVAAKSKAAADIDDEDNTGGAEITVDTTADVAAKGDSVHGAAGAQVDVAVGVRNLGPATLDNVEGNHAVHFEFVVPAGTEVVKTSHAEDCYVNGDDVFNHPFEPGKPAYTCISEQVIQAGTDFTVTFTLKINQVTANAKGQVRVLVSGDAPDRNAANNAADVLVNPSGNGGTLPITGVRIGVFGAVGAAVIALGTVLFVLARRRRVVLVTGADGGE